MPDCQSAGIFRISLVSTKKHFVLFFLLIIRGYLTVVVVQQSSKTLGLNDWPLVELVAVAMSDCQTVKASMVG